MKYLPILGLCGIVLLFISDLHADSIYTWTDENGVRRYSNTEPSNDAKDVQIIKEIPHTRNDDKESGQNESELERIIDRLETENRAAKIEEEKKKTAQDKLNKKIQKEKERLQNEIKRIEQLAVGRSFSLAMKKFKLKEYTDKINLLERSPEEYFSANAP